MSGIAMDISIESLRSLPMEKRLELIEALWESVERDAGPEAWPISREVIEEASREFDAHVADPGTSIPWETVRARLFERYG